jgi:8-oxo-dGTP pyrophosphatase MutT (NUDIX family)
MGLQLLRPHGAHLLRVSDLSRSATEARLDRLRETLARRVRVEVDAGPPLIRAGVLVPLLPGGDGIELLFTRRTETVLTHKGQISFPGGQREEGDDTLVETALRETSEEIGLEPHSVDVLGELDDVFTAVSGFVITPVVGWISEDPGPLRVAPTEVERLIRVPLRRLLDPDVHTSEDRVFNGESHTIHYFRVGDDVIWGATGRILHQFLNVWQMD